MGRIEEEKLYWDKAAEDPNVRDNWIVDKTLKDEDFIKLLKPILKGRVLEIGCGIGRLSELYDCGIDISPKMLKLAPKGKEHKLCDGRTIPYPDESFDSVFCVEVFQHIPYTKPYIEEAKRVLKPGGSFVFQYIEGDSEDGPFSFRHTPLLGGWQGCGRFKGILPEWSWVVAAK